MMDEEEYKSWNPFVAIESLFSDSLESDKAGVKAEIRNYLSSPEAARLRRILVPLVRQRLIDTANDRDQSLEEVRDLLDWLDNI